MKARTPKTSPAENSGKPKPPRTSKKASSPAVNEQESGSPFSVERELRWLINNTDEPFMIVDRELNVVTFNQKFNSLCEIFLRDLYRAVVAFSIIQQK
ncbi:MAG: hypothetical protein NVV59_07445 [Chitinophagaceae bacterium]|nr:hypothetical protein [Chitinophagaceae bacterium]